MDSASWASEKRQEGVPEEDILDVGYVLKIHAPENALFYSEKGELERFIIPQHYRNLGNYLLGFYRLTQKRNSSNGEIADVVYIPFKMVSGSFP